MLPARFTPAFLRQLELLHIRSRKAFFGSRQGGHLSPKRGHGLEFSDYRKYEPGDNPRHIDWGVYARSDRLYVKTFREEQDLSVLVLLDTSASMSTPAGEGKWEMARDLALSVAYIALMEQDRVTLSALSQFHTPHYSGVRAIHDLSRAFTELKPAAPYDLVKEVQRAAVRVRFPGKAVFISDFLMPIEQVRTACNLLRAKNLEIVALQVLSPSDISPLAGMTHAIAQDSESGEEVPLVLDAETREVYEQLLSEHTAALENYFGEAHIGYAVIRTDDDITQVVLESLPQVGLVQ